MTFESLEGADPTGLFAKVPGDDTQRCPQGNSISIRNGPYSRIQYCHGKGETPFGADME